MTEQTTDQPSPRRLTVILRTGALLAIAILAAYLRLSGIEWGARHPFHTDERVYVENVVAMLDSGDFDHRFYTYPGLFYYILRLVLSPLSDAARHSSDAYVLARIVVACFGLLNIVAIAFVGSRVFGVPGALAAALFAALAPVDVDTSHQIRPDVILQLAGLTAVVVFQRLGPKLKHDIWAGALIGVSTAIKFTGLLLVPSYILARVLAPGRRVDRLVAAGILSIVIVLACTPYAAFHFAQYRHGPGAQLQLYHVGDVPWSLVRTHVQFFLNAHLKNLGMMGVIAAFAGVVLSLRQPRIWIPVLVYPIVNLLVMSTSSQVYTRWILPAIDIPYLLIGMAFAYLFDRPSVAVRGIAALLLAASALGPARASADLAHVYAAESPQDRALDWILAHVDRGARILETRPGAHPSITPGAMVGIPTDRYEVIFSYMDQRSDLLPLLERNVDLVLVDPGEGWRGLRTVYRAPDAYGHPAIVLKTAVDPPTYSPVPMSAATLSASSSSGVSALTDGDLSTRWVTPSTLKGSEWIQVDFPTPVRVGRVELVVPGVLGKYDPEIAIESSSDGTALESVTSIPLRPQLSEQNLVLGPSAEDVLIKPKPVRAIRVLQLGARPYPWAVAELRLYERRDSAGSDVVGRDTDK